MESPQAVTLANSILAGDGFERQCQMQATESDSVPDKKVSTAAPRSLLAIWFPLPP
jgi:hypothetical protein